MVSLLDSLEDRPGQVALVASNDPDAGGLAKAQARGVATLALDHTSFANRAEFETALHQKLLDHGIDVICLAGFMRILTAEFTAKWEGRMLNIHPSLLPKYKGLHTHQRAIDAGDKTHGCTVHLVTAALDDGPILGQAVVPILPDDTAETLAARVLIEEHRLFPAVLHKFLADLESDPLDSRLNLR